MSERIYGSYDTKSACFDAPCKTVSHSGRYELLAEGCETSFVLQSLENYGLINTIKKLEGAFALVIFDRELRSIYLVRDKIGQKPLCYMQRGSVVVFSSTLKPIESQAGFTGIINRDTLALYMRYGYYPAPYSVYTNVCKVMPGQYVEFSEKGERAFTYWDYLSLLKYEKPEEKTIEEETEEEKTEEEKTVIEDVEKLLRASVIKYMRGYGKVGTLLSGGVDSSLITALAQSLSNERIKTFTMGFNEEKFNEAKFAEEVARHLNTDHTDYYMSANDAIKLISQLPYIYDEPFADPSQIPTCLVAQLAKKDVDVVLTGDGGDELFCGYTSYHIAAKLYRKTRRIPNWLLKMLGYMLIKTPLSVSMAFASRILPTISANSLVRGANMLLQSDNLLSITHSTRSVTEKRLVIGANPVSVIWNQPSLFDGIEDPYKLMMAADFLMTLPDGMCVKIDKASQGCNLTANAPVLFDTILDYSMTLSGGFLTRHGQKWVLKQILYKYVPKDLIERPKKGFGVPIGEWLKYPLRNWAEELICSAKSNGYFDSSVVQKLWDEHLIGKRNNYIILWRILMFQAWFMIHAK